MKRLLIVVAATMAVACGCAANNSHAVSPKAAKTLESYLVAVRTAANGTNTPALRAAVNALNTKVEALSAEGEITKTRAGKIENQAAALLDAFKAAKPTATPTPSVTSPTPTVTPTTPGPIVTVTITPTPTPTPTPTKTKPTSSPTGTPVV